MTAKEYLGQIRSINIRLGSMAQKRQSLHDALMNISPNYSFLPRAATPDVHKMEKLIAAKVDLENEMLRLGEKLAGIHETLTKITDADLSAIITSRYIGGKTWFDISNELHISESHLYRLHIKALAEVQKLIANESK